MDLQDKSTHRPRWLRLSIAGAKVVFLLAGCYATGRWVDIGIDLAKTKTAEATQWVEKQVTREVVVHKLVDPDTVPVETMIEDVAGGKTKREVLDWYRQRLAGKERKG